MSAAGCNNKNERFQGECSNVQKSNSRKIFNFSEIGFQREFFRSQKPLKSRQWWPWRAEQGGGIIITDIITTIITTIITIINNTINIIDNGDLEEQSKERETKEEQKSSRDQGGQQVDRDVAGELGFCSTFVVQNKKHQVLRTNLFAKNCLAASTAFSFTTSSCARSKRGAAKLRGLEGEINVSLILHHLLWKILFFCQNLILESNYSLKEISGNRPYPPTQQTSMSCLSYTYISLSVLKDRFPQKKTREG